jgi:hypothetical protein
VIEAVRAGTLPGGSSRPGLVFGVVGGLIILFEFAIWPRKMVRAWRLGSAQWWLRAHIWLGLLSLPLVLMHARLLFIGGWLNVALMVLFLLVIASGVFGLAMQQYLPRAMLERVPAETIYAQIDHVARQQAVDARELVMATCGKELGERTEAFGVVTGFRSMTGIQGKVLETRPNISVIPGTEMIETQFEREIEPYLLDGNQSRTRLVGEFAARRFFAELREQCPVAAVDLVDKLEGLSDQRRQFDLQKRLHAWLHVWLSVHLPLSIALVVLLAMHVYVALRYW